MINPEIEKEILDAFIPQIYYKTKNKTIFRWNKGNGYVEVVLPSYKYGKNLENETYITTSTGQTKYSKITNMNAYNLGTLRCMLNVLNRS